MDIFIPAKWHNGYRYFFVRCTHDFNSVNQETISGCHVYDIRYVPELVTVKTMKDVSTPKPSVPKQKAPGNIFKKDAAESFFAPANKASTQDHFFSSAANKPAKLLQRKLNISEPNDASEKEADVMAEKVIQRSENIDRSPMGTGTNDKDISTTEQALASSKGGGNKMPEGTLQKMESSFNRDFSQVRIHDNSAAVQMSRDLNAQAFTQGNDIYFNAGKFDPHSRTGQHLLAHELTHTIQQGHGSNLNRQSRPNITVAPTPQSTRGKKQKTNAPEAKSNDAFLPGLPVRLTRNSGSKKESVLEHKQKLASVAKVGKKNSTVPLKGVSKKKPVTDIGRIPGKDSPVKGGRAAIDVEDGGPARRLPVRSVAPKPIKAPVAKSGGSQADRTAEKAAKDKAINIQIVTARLFEDLQNKGNGSTEIVANDFELRIKKLENDLTTERANLQRQSAQKIDLVSNHAEKVKGSIESSRANYSTEIGAFAESQIASIRTDINSKRTEANTSIAARKGTTDATASAEIARAKAESEERANRILAKANSIGFSGDQPSVDAQKDAAQKIASQTAAQCREAGNSMASGIQEELAKHRNVYDELLSNYSVQLSQSESEAIAAVQQFAEAAQNHNNSTAEKSVEAIQKGSAENISALGKYYLNAETESSTIYSQQILKLKTEKLSVVEQCNQKFSALTASLNEDGMTMSNELATMHISEEQAEKKSGSILASLTQKHGEIAGALTKWQGSTIGGLNSMQSAFLAGQSSRKDEKITKSESFATHLLESLNQAKSSTDANLAGNVSSFKTSIASSTNTAMSKLAEARASFESQAGALHNEAIVLYAKLVDEGLAKQDGILAKAESEMTGAVGKIDSKYNALKDQAQKEDQAQTTNTQAKIQRSIWGSITGFFSDMSDWVKKKLVSWFGEFWGGLVYGILETLLIVVVGAALIFGLAWVIVSVFALTVAVAKVALIIGLVLLVLVVVPLMIYNRFQEYKQDHGGEGPGFWAGFGLVLIGILDVTGIPYIVEGIAGKRITGGELKDFDSGVRLGTGIVMLATAIFSVIKGIRGGKPVVPVKETPVLVDPLPKPKTPLPVEPIPDEPPRVKPQDPPVPKPKTLAEMTVPELQAEMDPVPRAGETPAQAAARVEAARLELELRHKMGIYDALGEKPSRFDVLTNDAAHSDAHTVGTKGNPGRHSPLMELRRSLDGAGVPDGKQTVEGRIYGDAPWAKAESNSAKWNSVEVINRIVNKYLQGNWETVRSDLAQDGVHAKAFPADEVAGQGFFNENFGKPKATHPPKAVGPVPTNMVRLTFLLVKGSNPPVYYLITGFPTVSGM